MRAYSMDLRERVLLDSDAGMKAADVAAKYRVSGSWVRLLKQRRRETGEVAPRVQRHGRRPMLEPHLHTLAAMIAEQPDRTLVELQDELGTPASLATICELAGCDLLTIAPKLLSALQATEGHLPRKLTPETAAAHSDKLSVDEATFQRMHAEDRMATEKLSEGITRFSKAIVALERLLGYRLEELEGRECVHRTAQEVFGVYDLDGDGAITREEWAGTRPVFDALDVDGDGRITPQELAAGLGGAFCLEDGDRRNAQ